MINLDEYKSIGTYWIALYVNDDVTYFDSFGVELKLKLKNIIGNRSITTNTFTIPVFDSIMCGYFYIAFFDFKLKGNSLIEYNSLFPPNEYEINEKIILKYFK